MPAPLYLHPFMDHNHNIGFGPEGSRIRPSSTSLHGIAPTLSKRSLPKVSVSEKKLKFKSRAHFRYLWQMGGKDALTPTFRDYRTEDHRIYVLGHCGRGLDYLHSQENPTDDQKCTALQLCEIFRNHGLPEDSQAHIRIHACHSASPSRRFATLSDGINMHLSGSFTDVFFAELRKTHKHVSVRGYNQTTGPYLMTRWGEDCFTSANAHHIDYYGRPSRT